ncbi:MAG: HIRAN domain-containing protein, partial [Plesiomonas shigelloides]
IGNSDRHQENWGVVLTPELDESGKLKFDDNGRTQTKGALSPLYDNGTSLGHERYVDRISGWRTKDLDAYIDKGMHHLRQTRQDTRQRLGHIKSIQALAADEATMHSLQERLNFDVSQMCGRIRALCDIPAGEGALTHQRADWVIRLLQRRCLRLRLITKMRTISHFVEPEVLLLVWQPIGGGVRYVVGHIRRLQDGQYELTYAYNTPDYNKALECGFSGHPAFALREARHTVNVLEPFLRRLPPRKRKDFSEYLAQHLLPSDFSGSDFALLGYTGAKSPGDGFSLLIDPTEFGKKCELLLEVAGTRYQTELDLTQVHVGDRVSFVAEPDNEFDADAVAVVHSAGKLGYVNRLHCKAVKRRLRNQSLHGFIGKKNGTASRPLVYLFVECE